MERRYDLWNCLKILRHIQLLELDNVDSYLIEVLIVRYETELFGNTKEIH